MKLISRFLPLWILILFLFPVILSAQDKDIKFQLQCPDHWFRCGGDGTNIKVGTCLKGAGGCLFCDDNYSESCRKYDPSCSPSITTRIDGCSAPGPDIDIGPIGRFEKACNEHDVCYSTLGRSKKDCDTEFNANMVLICMATFPVGDPKCLADAATFFSGVTLFGGSSYEKGQKWAQENCNCN